MDRRYRYLGGSKAPEVKDDGRCSEKLDND